MRPDTVSQTHDPALNRLLRSLPVGQRQRLAALCRGRSLQVDGKLAPTGLLFPLSGHVSECLGSGPWAAVQLGHVGAEGVIGAAAVLGHGRGALHATVCAAGSALVLAARGWQEALLVAPSLASLIQRYQGLQAGRLARCALCLGFHPAQARLARWLLAADDRSPRSPLAITHERLAVLLGLRRSGITVCARSLQAAGLIEYRRGEVRILDRRGLEGMACDCYADDRLAYRRAFPVRV